MAPSATMTSSNNMSAPAPQSNSGAPKTSSFAQLLAKSGDGAKGEDLQNMFNGEWKNKQGQSIDVRGTMVNQRPIFTVENSTTVFMTMDGIKYTGTVTKNGKLIQWSDGDEWLRESVNSASPHVVPMQLDPPEPKTTTMGETPPISGDEEENASKKKKNKLKKKKVKKLTDGEAKKEIATKIKKWLRAQDENHKINRDDFKTIAKKCTERCGRFIKQN